TLRLGPTIRAGPRTTDGTQTVRIGLSDSGGSTLRASSTWNGVPGPVPARPAYSAQPVSGVSTTFPLDNDPDSLAAELNMQLEALLLQRTTSGALSDKEKVLSSVKLSPHRVSLLGVQRSPRRGALSPASVQLGKCEARQAAPAARPNGRVCPVWSGGMRQAQVAPRLAMETSTRPKLFPSPRRCKWVARHWAKGLVWEMAPRHWAGCSVLGQGLGMGNGSPGIKERRAAWQPGSLNVAGEGGARREGFVRLTIF
ncbi:hypothetical protein Droror1_Dr00024239, partial [Drosera rotundifolia]